MPDAAGNLVGGVPAQPDGGGVGDKAEVGENGGDQGAPPCCGVAR